MSYAKIKVRLLGAILGIALLMFHLPSQASALIHTSITGKVIAVNMYKGHVVRLTVQKLDFPKSQRDVVIKPETKIFGKDSAPLYSTDLITKGMILKADGGLTTFANRIVADKIYVIQRTP